MEELKKHKNMVTTKQIVALGLSKTTLSNYLKKGKLIKISHGIYMIPGEIIDEMYLFMVRSNNVIFSHETGLFLNGLENVEPTTYSVTVPSNNRLSFTSMKKSISYCSNVKTYELGLIELRTKLGNHVRAYNPERCICDLLGNRHQQDEKKIVEILERYLSSENQNMKLLIEYSIALRVHIRLLKYFEKLRIRENAE